MQTRIGKKRYSRLPWTSKGSKVTRFLCCGLVLVGLATTSSCSLFQKKSDKSLVQSLQGICLTGSGKGRIEFEGGRHLFNYESLLKDREQRWALGLNLPIIGQEILELDIPRKLGEPYKVRGTFAKRLKLDIKSKRDRVLLGKFFQRLSEFTWVVSHKDTSSAEAHGWGFYHDGEDIFGEVQISKEFTFKFKSFSFNQDEKFYERIGLSIARNSSSKGSRKAQGFEKDYIQLQLFVSSCEL
ncbi:MAG: hypothetical protein CME63_13085 [Halobacteriovoraceae bacterium]|nr:hypothetical protein [Halobacteriovoraceae bacterium]